MSGSCLVVSQPNGAGALPHGSPFPSHLEELSFSQHSGAEALPRGSPSPSHLEESSYDLFFPDGSVGSSSSAASGREGIHLVEPGVGEGRLQTICMLQNALLSDGTQPCECHFFQLCLKISCQSHGVIVHEGSDFGDETLVYGRMWSAKDEQEHTACDTVCRGPADIVSTLIGIVLRLEGHYPAERLSEIARAIGLVGAPSVGMKRRSEGALVILTTSFYPFSSCLGSREHNLLAPTVCSDVTD